MAASSFLDLAAFVVALVFAALGAKRGLIREVFRFAALLGGVLISFMYYRDFEALLGSVSSNRQVVAVTAFLAVFFIAFFAITGIGLLLRRFTKAIALGWLDHMLGLALGVLKAAVIVWAACLSISSVPVQSFQEQFGRSVVYKAFKGGPKFMSLESMEKARAAFRRDKKDN